MKRSRAWVLVTLAGVSACSLPFSQSTVEAKVECDRLAAQAIETTSLDEARDLATAAARCYADAR